MILSNLPEFTLHPIENRGIPNMERILIYINENVDMGQYGIMLGLFNQQTKTALPSPDKLFWFGDGIVNKGDWLVIYSGKGKPQTQKNDSEDSNIFYLYWNSSMTIFTNTQVVPILFRADAVEITYPPEDQPQIGIPYEQ